MTQRPVEVDEVIRKVQRQTLDMETLTLHEMCGTTEKYYEQLLTEIVTDMTILPLTRGFAGLDPLDDGKQIEGAFVKMVGMVATLFGMPQKKVEDDLVDVMHNYPVEDVKNAEVLRRDNRLQ